MKKIIAILGLMLVTYSSSASVAKICVEEARSACVDAVDYDFCFEYVMGDCFEQYRGYNKSVPACVQQCFSLPEEEQVDMCLHTCSPL